MSALVFLVAGPLLAVAAYLVTGAVRVERVERDASLQRALRYGAGQGTSSGRRPAKLVARLAAVLLRIRPGTDADALARRLRAAGLAHRITVESFLAVRIGTTAAGLGLGASWRFRSASAGESSSSSRSVRSAMPPRRWS